MKTIKIIQKVLLAVGIITVVSLVDGFKVPTSNKWAAIVILAFVMYNAIIVPALKDGNHENV